VRPADSERGREVAARDYRVEPDPDCPVPGALSASIAVLVAEATAFLAYHDPQTLVEIHDASPDQAGQTCAALRVRTRVRSCDIVDTAVRLSALACGLITTRA